MSDDSDVEVFWSRTDISDDDVAFLQREVDVVRDACTNAFADPTSWKLTETIDVNGVVSLSLSVGVMTGENIAQYIAVRTNFNRYVCFAPAGFEIPIDVLVEAQMTETELIHSAKAAKMYHRLEDLRHITSPAERAIVEARLTRLTSDKQR
jgi:hypothetical protein